jgi:NHL repeat
MRTAFFDGTSSRPARLGLALVAVVGLWLSLGGASALAAVEAHPQLTEFGSFSNPNGIAVDESTGDVYVADIGTDTVYKFNASGNPVNFPSLGSDALTGNATPAHSFSFPVAAQGTPAAIAVDNSASPSNPSAGDLYVMDAGHGVIDKFSPEGKYVGQITGFAPATGSPEENELLGLAVDATGGVRVDVRPSLKGAVAIDVFDDSSANQLVAKQLNPNAYEGRFSGVPEAFQETSGFAVGPTGDDYLLYQSCSCVAKLGQQLAGLGNLENREPESSVVAVGVDPATGHVYVESHSSIAEWDTGAMNGTKEAVSPDGPEGGGTLVGERFTAPQLSGSTGQGGLAVDGASGEIYVSNPTNGKVYVFGSELPAASTGAASGVTKETASLNGAVDPRGVPLSSCEFQYGVADEWGQGSYDHTVLCKQTPAEIGSGHGPVSVSADIEGLTPGLLYRFRLLAGNAGGVGETSGLLATAGVGFGIKGFGVSFLNEDGAPDTQAGSHPYKMVTNIEFNSRFLRTESNADSPYVREPDGTLKDLAVDLPPGLVGDPNATAKKCTLQQLIYDEGLGAQESLCPGSSRLGDLHLEYSNHIYYGSYKFDEPVFNIEPPRGVALQLGLRYDLPDLFINNGLLTGGDYPIQATIVNAPPAAPVIDSTLTIFGEAGQQLVLEREQALRENKKPTTEETNATLKPFLTLPTGCNGPLRSTIEVDSYQEPNNNVKKEAITRNSAGTPVALTGCSRLRFPPTITVVPDTTNASTSSGLTVGVHVPQTAAQNAEGLAESALRDTTVELPAGVALNPAGANGLEACSEDLAGFEIGRGVSGSGFEEFNPELEPGVKTPLFTPTPIESLQPGVSLCPDGAKIGTVKIKTPLLEHELEGSVYLASQESNPFGSLIAMYLMVEDPVSGSTIKLTGEVQLCEGAGQVIDGVSCQGQGQIITTFKNTPDLPFEELQLHFFGGERAPLATPSRCGTYTTTAEFTPWDGNGAVTSESSFQIEHGPGGGACPGTSLPFSPSLTGGATNLQAGAFSPFTLTMSRKDGEQNMQSVEAHLPPGMLGVLSNIELCPEPQANLGECGANSLIGETTVSVGVGNEPFTVSGGKFYLTGPYNGSGACTVGTVGCAPFGVSFVVPAKAGPYDLANTQSNHPPCDCVLVRGKIEVNPETSAITITSNPPGTPDAIPTSIAGIPLEIQHITATTTRGDFQFNPTNCSKMEATGTIHSSEGGLDTIGVPFQVTNCADLKFEPKFTVSTDGKTSKAEGAGLTLKVTRASGPESDQANFAKVKVELPVQLPSRLTTLQKACTAAQFNTNPASCPAGSVIGHVKVLTPVLPVPLEGPAYFVSHGGEAFPSLIFVLQGYGVTLDVVSTTFINKAGITSGTLKALPDAPFTSFELTLPEGPHSALAANGKLCGKNLVMPTEFIAQNGAEIHQRTPIAVTGCAKAKPLTRAQKLAKALNACKKRAKGKRAACVRRARKQFGPLKKTKKKVHDAR